MAGMLIACAPATQSEKDLAALTRDAEMREVRVAQVTAAASIDQEKKKAPPVVRKDEQFAPPRLKTPEEIERDNKKAAAKKVYFAPPRLKTAEEIERDRQKQQKKPIRKVKVNEKTGEARLYDANNKDITETVSPRTKKVKVVTDPSGKWKLLDENGKQVTDGPPPPPPPSPDRERDAQKKKG